MVFIPPIVWRAMTVPNGLTAAEVEERKAAGLVNSNIDKTSKTYLQILMDNLCTGFNLLLFLLSIALILTGSSEKGTFHGLSVSGIVNAISVSGIIFMNVVISTIQECKAKRRLDKIALLLKPKVTVVRDGVPVIIDQEGIVKDDIIVLSPGDQALVDGELIQESYLEMDESLLTGESHTVRKKVGERIYSGSYCVVGDGYYKVDAFGENSFAAKMLASAKKAVKKKTPLQMETTTITLMLMGIAILYTIVTAIVFLATGKGISDITETVAVILEIVPIALFLLIVLTYMLAAIRMADSGVLLQDSSAVESISHVDTVCMDKTGTITTNRLRFKDAIPLSDKDVGPAISAYVGSVGGKNRTIDALEGEYGGNKCEVLDEIRFSSERKFSAAKIVMDGRTRAFYLGAITSFAPYIAGSDGIKEKVSEYSSRGLRTVVFAEADPSVPFDQDSRELPALSPIALFVIEDEVRPDCRETIEVFLNHNMDIKVISGDDPVTVDALFTIADIPGERRIISGDILAEASERRMMAFKRLQDAKAASGGASSQDVDAAQEAYDSADSEYADMILKTNIFGRMRPDQKEEVIDTLRAHGRYVAMIGDGVNDVKSLKRANVGVALESGSGAARGVADMVLVKDNFSALPKSIVEGKRTVSGMRDILKIYITRNLVLAILIAMSLIFLHKQPFNPVQNTFYAFFSVGVSAFFMTIWAKPSENSDLVLPAVLRFTIPTAFTIAVMGTLLTSCIDSALSSGMINFPGYEEAVAAFGPDQFTSSLLVLFLTFCGIFQLLVVDPHFKIFSIDGEVHKDWKPIILMCLLGVGAIAVYNMEFFLQLMSIPLLPIGLQIMMVGFAAIWLVIQQVILRWNKFTFMEDAIERWYLKSLEEGYKRELEKDMASSSE